MLYWERRRRRIAQQRSLSSSIAPYSATVSRPSTLKQCPFPEDLAQHSDSTPLPQYSSFSSIANGSVSLPSSGGVPDSLERASFDKRIYSSGVDEAPVTPAAFVDSLHWAHESSLPERKVGPMFCCVPKSPTTSFYQPVVIPGVRGKHRYHESVIVIARPPRTGRQQVMVHLAVFCLCLFVFVSVLMIASPVSDNERVVSAGQDFQPFLHLTTARGNSTAQAWSRIATATAVTVDGYDPGEVSSYPYVNTTPLPPSASDALYLTRFLVGQCTYWANMRYHQLTGHWVPWVGAAYEWAAQALSYGWMVADRPNPHGYSIMVMQPLVAGAGTYGHVAVVERTNADASVYTSSWNWKGSWHLTTYVTFTPQAGISFIWFP